MDDCNVFDRRIVYRPIKTGFKNNGVKDYDSMEILKTEKGTLDKAE